jgi:hypothetical protein
MKIRAISLWEPWATAWAIGLKGGETRSWRPPQAAIGAPLAICSARTERDPESGEHLRYWFHQRLGLCDESARAFKSAGVQTWHDLRRGHVIAICRLADVQPTTLAGMSRSALEGSWGNYSPGRFVWIPENMTRLNEPIPVIGRQGLFSWEVPAELHRIPEINRILAPSAK